MRPIRADVSSFQHVLLENGDGSKGGPGSDSNRLDPSGSNTSAYVDAKRKVREVLFGTPEIRAMFNLLELGL